MAFLRVLILLTVLLGINSVAWAQLNESKVVITEISYNPPESGVDSLEFIELYNVGSTSINLSGYTFTQGISYTFGSYTLAAGAYVIVAINAAAMQNVYGVTALQWTSGALSNNGEDIELYTAATGGTLVDFVSYGTGGSWPSAANGNGASLVLCNPVSDNQLPASWNAATTSTGITINGHLVLGNPNGNEPCPVVCPGISAGLGATVANESCVSANDGAITLSVDSGSAPFVYAWSNGAITKNLSGLTAGTYTVTVTDDNSCTGTKSFTVSAPTAPALGATTANASCANASNGSVNLTLTGGTGPFSYLWSNAAITEDITGVASGTYIVTVTYATGCTVSASYTVGTAALATLSGVASDASCGNATDGSINLTVTGGSTPYTYAWSNGATTEDVTGLGTGAYTVTVSYAGGCTVSGSYTVGAAAAATLSGSVSNATCNGINDGAINLTVTGGSTPYTYAWSNGATTEDVTGLGTGAYTVTVTYAGGCTVSGSYTVGAAATATLSGSVGDATCNGINDGSVNLTVTGGAAPYTYAWSNGATTEDIFSVAVGTYSVTVTYAGGCTVSGSYTVGAAATATLSGSVSNATCNGINDGAINLTVTGGSTPYTYAWSNSATTEDVTGLAVGSYTVTVTYGGGCTATSSYTVSAPATATLSGAVSNASCNGANDGSIDLTVSGGTSPYTYAWSNSATTEDVTGLSAGTYTVTVSYAGGCSATANYTITEPIALVLSATVQDAGCNGGNDGEIDLSVSGGTMPYTFAWDNAATTEDITGLADGTYQVTVTDANGCLSTDNFTIAQVSSLAIIANITDASCLDSLDGAIALTVSGGNAPYTYAWDNAETTATITGLAVGDYTVSITDANGCSTSETIEVDFEDSCRTVGIFSPADIERNLSVYPNPTSGIINIELTGNDQPLAVSLHSFSGSEVLYQAISTGSLSLDVSNLSAGIYLLTLHTTNGQIARTRVLVAGR